MGRLGRGRAASAVTAVFGLLALPAAAGADDAWRPPLTLANKAGLQDLALTPTGEALVLIRRGQQEFGSLEVRSRPAGGTFGSATTIASNAAGADAEMSATGEALVVYRASDGSKLVIRAPGGKFGRPEQAPATGKLAMDAAGNAVLVWLEVLDNEQVRMRVWAAYRLAGASFGAPEVVAETRAAYAPDVAFAGSSKAIVVWSESGGNGVRRVVAARGGPAGFRQPETISNLGRDVDRGFGNPNIATNARGDAAVVWSGSDESAAFADEVDAAIKPAGAGFRPAETISARDNVAIRPDVAVDRRGNVISAWNSGSSAISAAYRPRGGSFEHEQIVSGGSDEQRVGFDVRGNAIVLWRVIGGSVNGLDSVIRATKGGFGPVESVTSDRMAPNAPLLAFDAVGNGLAVWQRGWGNDAEVETALYDRARPILRFFALRELPGRAGSSARRRRPAFRFKLTEPARVTITVDRCRSSKCRRYARVRLLGRKGFNRRRLKRSLVRRLARKGRYRVRATVRDSAGRSGRSRRVRFTQER